jgi:O-antigen ligase
MATVSILPPFVVLQSRSGFLVFVTIGFVLGLLRWRRIFALLPLAGVLVVLLVPSVGERIRTGLEEKTSINWDEVSAGRLTNLWPAVIHEIQKAPWFGQGRYTILRKDCKTEIMYAEGSVPKHPHNAYLEVLLDAGAIGLIISMAWMSAMAMTAVRLSRSHAILAKAVGAIGLCGVIAELCAGVTGSSFFPSQSTVPYLCIWGTMIRLHAQSRTARPAHSFIREPILAGRLAGAS